MDEQTMGQGLAALIQRRHAGLENVFKLAKTLEPLLRDLGHNNSADRLQAALGEVETADAEAQAFFTKHPEAAVAFLLGQMKSR